MVGMDPSAIAARRALLEETPSIDTGHVVDLLAYLAGGLSALGESLGHITPQSISHWKDRGIPVDRCGAINKLYGVPVWRLRPHDWHEHWPMLVGTEGAPAVPDDEPTAKA